MHAKCLGYRSWYLVGNSDGNDRSTTTTTTTSGSYSSLVMMMVIMILQTHPPNTGFLSESKILKVSLTLFLGLFCFKTLFFQ